MWNEIERLEDKIIYLCKYQYSKSHKKPVSGYKLLVTQVTHTLRLNAVEKVLQ